MQAGRRGYGKSLLASGTLRNSSAQTSSGTCTSGCQMRAQSSCRRDTSPRSTGRRWMLSCTRHWPFSRVAKSKRRMSSSTAADCVALERAGARWGVWGETRSAPARPPNIRICFNERSSCKIRVRGLRRPHTIRGSHVELIDTSAGWISCT